MSCSNRLAHPGITLLHTSKHQTATEPCIIHHQGMTSVCLMSAPPTSPLRSTPRTGSSLPTRMYQTGEDRNTVVMRQPKFALALKVVETSRRFDPKHKLLVNIVEYTCTCSVCWINTVIIFVPGELLTICKENFGPY